MKAITIVLASALITTGALKAAPLLAEPAQGPSNIVVSRVSTSDLDLSSRSGLKTLDHRLARAAREVCGQASDFDVEGKNDVRQCRNDTLARARIQRDSVLAAASHGAVIAVTAAR